MANLVFDFLHNYKTGERRDSDPADAYQYDEGHVFEAVVPVAVTSCEIHYWARGFDEAEAYTPASITQNTDNSYTITGNIPNKFFETYGDLRVYIVVTDGDASITTYEGRIHICERSRPDDYVDDDPDNEATRVLVEARAAAATATEAAQTAQEVAESIPADYSQMSEDVDALKTDVTDLKEDLTYNDGLIYLGKDEITSITGRKITIDNGHIVIKDNPNNYWKTLLVPVECLYIDGTATLKSGGLAGGESINVPTMAFLDENWNVVGTPVYTAIPAPHTFAESDVPTGAVYVALCYSNTFVFAFKSIAIKTKDNKQVIDSINNGIEDAGKYEIELNFVSTTGYYNGAKGYTTYESVTAAKINVNVGDIFYLTSRNYYGMARVAFMNESDTCIAVLHTGNNTTNMENTRFVVPENTATMLIQTVYGYACTLWKTDIKERIDINASEINAIEEATTAPLTTDVALTYVSATGYYAKNKAFTTYEGVTTATIPVSGGEEYLLTTRNYYNAAIACLLDSNDAVNTTVWIANNTAEVKSYKITIPNGISKLMIQRLYAYEPTKLELVTGIKSKAIKSVLNGKRMTIIGDSITEKNSRAKTNWALWIKDWADPTIQNLGASGTGFIAGGSNPYSNRISRIDNPDIIGVACSFNDMSNTVADLTTAAETFFDDLITAYPSTPIICYVQSPWSAYHYGVTTSDAWVDALREICNKRGIPFYDGMYKGTVLKPWLAANRAVYYINDGDGNTGEEDWVHPNSEGHKAIARFLYPKFVENLVATGLDYLV